MIDSGAGLPKALYVRTGIVATVDEDAVATEVTTASAVAEVPVPALRYAFEEAGATVTETPAYVPMVIVRSAVAITVCSVPAELYVFAITVYV